MNMKQWTIPFIAGYISANISAFVMIVALFALAGDSYWVLLAAIPVLLIVAQLSLVLFCRWSELNPPPWWHGTVYLILGTVISFPMFFLLAYVVEAGFDNRVPIILFWIVYSLEIGLVGMILLIAYRVMFTRRNAGHSRTR